MITRVTGNWIYLDRRWLNPTDTNDFTHLNAGYDLLCAAHPSFAFCSRHSFLDHLARVSLAWDSAQRSFHKNSNERLPLEPLNSTPPTHLTVEHNSSQPTRQPQAVEHRTEIASLYDNYAASLPRYGTAGAGRTRSDSAGDGGAGAAAVIAVPMLLNPSVPVAG